MGFLSGNSQAVPMSMSCTSVRKLKCYTKRFHKSGFIIRFSLLQDIVEKKKEDNTILIKKK